MKIIIIFLMGLISVEIAAKTNTSIMFAKGYKADIEFSSIICRHDTEYGLSTSHGYIFGNGLYVGGGTGIYINSIMLNTKRNRILIPVFAEIKYSFINKIASPFVGLKVGGIADFSAHGTGYTIRPSFGIDVWRFSISVGWNHNRLGYSGAGNITNPEIPTFERRGHSGVFVGLSYSF